MGFLYLLPLSVGAPVDHVTLLSHKSAGSNVGPHNVFFFFRKKVLNFCFACFRLIFRWQTLQQEMLGGVSYENIPFRMAAIHLVLAGMAR